MKTNNMKNKGILRSVALAGIGAYALVQLSSCSQYGDVSSGKDTEGGRTRNSLAALVSGVVANQMYEKSDINLTMEKTLYPDAKVNGHTGISNINTSVDLWFADADFNADRKENGMFEGKVYKTEWNWKINQKNSNIWEVVRFGLKFNNELDLTCKDGKINGEFKRPMGFNWDIDGTYDSNGNTKIHVNIPEGYDFDLNGKINKINNEEHK